MNFKQYLKSNSKNYITFISIALFIVLYHPKNSLRFWSAFSAENKAINFVLEIIINSLMIALIYLFERRIRLKRKLESVIKKVPAHREGSITFFFIVIFVFVACCLMFFSSNYISNEVIQGYLFDRITIVFTLYLLYLVG